MRLPNILKATPYCEFCNCSKSERTICSGFLDNFTDEFINEQGGKSIQNLHPFKCFFEIHRKNEINIEIKWHSCSTESHFRTFSNILIALLGYITTFFAGATFYHVGIHVYRARSNERSPTTSNENYPLNQNL